MTLSLGLWTHAPLGMTTECIPARFFRNLWTHFPQSREVVVSAWDGNVGGLEPHEEASDSLSGRGLHSPQAGMRTPWLIYRPCLPIYSLSATWGVGLLLPSVSTGKDATRMQCSLVIREEMMEQRDCCTLSLTQEFSLHNAHTFICSLKIFETLT